jgi:hypothetical protein
MTSPPRQIKVSCPQCGHLYQDWCRDSINFDLDPEMDDEEYLDECSSSICPECKHKVDLGTLKVEEDSLEGEVYWDPSKPKPNPYKIKFNLPGEEDLPQ